MSFYVFFCHYQILTNKCGRRQRVAHAARDFRALRKAVFIDKHLKITTKRKIYNDCVISVLLYAWSRILGPFQKARKKNKLNNFHHQYIRNILAFPAGKKWSEHITMARVRRWWGDEETASEKVKRKMLEWLGLL